MADRLITWWQYLLPRHFLAWFARRLCDSQQPWIKRSLIRYFLHAHSVDLREAEHEDAEAYASFNAFFTRALKPGLRPLCTNAGSVVAPVDGRLSEFGVLSDTSLLQAKGQAYSLPALLASAWSRNEHLRNGLYATVYLGPQDYHRVHAPVASRLLHTTYVPGRLFSVDPRIVQQVPALYARNERLICEFDSPFGRYVLVMVGAGLISGIVTRWDAAPARSELSSQSFTDLALYYAKGEELAHFRLGSTVLVLLPPNSARWFDSLVSGQRVWLGTAMAERPPV